MTVLEAACGDMNQSVHSKALKGGQSETVPDSETKELLAYWKSHLKSLTEIQLPTDYPRHQSAATNVGGASDSDSTRESSGTRINEKNLPIVEDEYRYILDDSDCLNLLQISLQLTQELGNSHPARLESGSSASLQVTPYSILLSAFAILVHRYTAESDLTLLSGNLCSDDSSNPLLLRFTLDKEISFQQLVLTIFEAERTALRNYVKFDDLLSHLEGKDGDSGAINVSSLTRIRMFNLIDPKSSKNAINGSEALNSLENALARQATGASDISVLISNPHTPQKIFPLEIRVLYNTVLFKRERIQDMVDQLIMILRQIFPAKNGSESLLDAPIDRINLVTERAVRTASIPDPKDDLVLWSKGEWPGAIHECFMRNALLYPSRVCVEEYLDASKEANPGSSVNYFTYQHINDASSVLSQAILASDIPKASTVTIYAHRSVELVVAIMATLKSGCVFSVIDPQYPVARQIVYLKVARPSCVLVLDKAGDLNEEVMKFLIKGKDGDSVIDLRCFIPGISLTPPDQSGFCLIDSSDHPLNKNLKQLSSRYVADFAASNGRSPEWIHENLPKVGPDSIGTLSFTSGSTGIPKGVRGRHYSLTHFYPWMSKEFFLNANDRFTMLSGIAHDPIQRDIFTPLFFGATICIPTSTHIGTPGALSRWLLTSKCTITHLTPAMGQLMVAGAEVEVPALRMAFFVGDILTKKDVSRLLSVAPRVTVINMYGTTETQRAVSYFPLWNKSAMEFKHEDESLELVRPRFAKKKPVSLENLKDVIPAGQGMRGVQLLVVNSRGQMCGIGELGEIYVRSFGLAEGYLGLEEDTKKKFVHNFFRNEFQSEVTEIIDSCFIDKGPRDRMYKSGDLGRYRPDGAVECCGRADDQIKIRGFRIELREIDLHLSQHPAVQENVTLVKRDAYEEKMIVAYFVIDNKHIKNSGSYYGPNPEEIDVALVIKDVREHLRKKLASYAVPSVFVPMVKLPLTPNGKIDKNSLPFPDLASIASDPVNRTRTPGRLTALQLRLSEIWRRVLCPKPKDASENYSARNIDIEENFFDLGGHSIAATRLIFEIRQELKLDVDSLPLNLIFKCPTIEEMAAEIERISGFGVLDGVVPVVKSPTVSNTAKKLMEEKQRTKNEEVVDLTSELILPSEITPNETQISIFNLKQCISSDGQFFKPRHVLLTGATGFLGAFLLDSLVKKFPGCKVTCLVRAKDESSAWSRIEDNMKAHLLWEGNHICSNDIDSWKSRVSVAVGDLSKKWLGLGKPETTSPPQQFLEIAESVDAVVHNGAFVHWVYPYEKLKAANVGGTLEALKICTTGKYIKPFYFVSSTSVLDTPHYTELKTSSVLESDDLEGSRVGLKSGYGQSKWVSEKLLMMASKRNIPVSIIRPGYILGSTQSGVTNADDFLWRLMKGCIEIGSLPIIHNTVNACPVDYVADSCVNVMAKSHQSVEKLVYHVWNNQHVRFVDFFQALVNFGFEKTVSSDDAEQELNRQLAFIPYLEWRDELMKYTVSSADHALYPLLHFVLGDLPTSTKSPSLDNSNLEWANSNMGMKQWSLVTDRFSNEQNETANSNNDDNSLMEKYLTYLCQVGFFEWPKSKSHLAKACETSRLLVRSGE